MSPAGSDFVAAWVGAMAGKKNTSQMTGETAFLGFFIEKWLLAANQSCHAPGLLLSSEVASPPHRSDL